jgi:hypothetical protein
MLREPRLDNEADLKRRRSLWKKTPAFVPEDLAVDPIHRRNDSEMESRLSHILETKGKVLSFESESFEIKGLNTSFSTTSTRMGSPKEELGTMEGFTIKVDGHYVAGLPQVFLETPPLNPFFWQCKEQVAPLAFDLLPPHFDSRVKEKS